MNLKPIRGQVVVLPDPPKAQIGLIVVPDAVNADNPNYFSETGRVVALAPHSFTDDGEDRRPFDVKVGERVHFGRYAGKQVTCSDDNIRYLVMFEHEINMVIPDDMHILHGYEAPADSGAREHLDRSGKAIDPLAHLL